MGRPPNQNARQTHQGGQQEASGGAAIPAAPTKAAKRRARAMGAAAEKAAAAELLADGALLVVPAHRSLGPADLVALYPACVKAVQVKAATVRVGNCDRKALRALAAQFTGPIFVELWLQVAGEWRRERFFADGRTERT